MQTVLILGTQVSVTTRDEVAVCVAGWVKARDRAYAVEAADLHVVTGAPQWCQSAGLEWAYRIWREPRRLFRRYFVYNSLFIYYRLREAVGVERRTGPA